MIDASIPLSGQSFRAPDILAAYGKAMTVRNMMLQSQREQQLLRQGEMESQAMQQAQADQEKLRRAYVDAGGDLAKTEELGRQYGASVDSLMKLRAQITEEKTKMAAMDPQTLAVQQQKNEMLRGMLQPILDEPDDNRAAQLLSQAYPAAKAQGIVDRRTEEMMRQVMPQGFTRDGLKMMSAGLTTGAQLIKEANEADKTTANLMRAQVTQQRADTYERSIENLSNYRGAGLELRQKLLKQQISRDTMLDDYRRDALQQQLEIVDRQIAGAHERQQMAGEQAMERTQYTQGAISERSKRVQNAITYRQMQKGQTGPQALKITEAALRVASKLPGFDDLSEEDQISAINTLIDSGIGNIQPVVTPGAQRGTLQKVGDALGVTEPPQRTIVKSGAPITPPATAGAPTAAPAAQPQKITTRAMVQKYADENRIPYAQAEAAFKAKGWTITER